MKLNLVMGCVIPEGAIVNIRQAIRGIIVDQEDILLIKTNKGDYKMPGGGMEEGDKYTLGKRKVALKCVNAK